MANPATTQPTSPARLPTALRALLQLLVEVEAARRPLRALTPHATRAVVSHLEVAPRRPADGQQLSVGTIRWQQIGRRVHVAAVTWRGHRAEALVAELGVVDGRWLLVTAARPSQRDSR